MKIFYSIEDCPTFDALTIGNFDGLHIGHQALIQSVKQYGTSALLTFSNHPRSFFDPNITLLSLTTLDHKIALLEGYGIDYLILLPFTRELANLTYREFIEKLKKHLSFSHLVLGKGATFGKGAEGDESKINALAEEMQFKAHYVPKAYSGETVVSSGRVRNLIEMGELTEAANLLGRPFAYYKKNFKVKKGLRMISIVEKDFISPPPGIYRVYLTGEVPAIASIQKSQHSLSLDLYFTGELPSKDFLLTFPSHRIENPSSIESYL